MNTNVDTTVAMTEETAADNMTTLENAITNFDVVNTANAGVPFYEEPDLLANADDDKPYSVHRSNCLLVVLMVLLLIVLPGFVTMGVTTRFTTGSRGDSGDSGDSGELVTAVPDGTADVTSDPLKEVSDDPPEMPAVRKSNIDQVIAYMVNTSVSDLTDLLTIGSPQNRAAIWMAEQDAADTAVPNGNTTALEGYNYMVRYVMAVFYYSTGGDNWHAQYFSMTFAPVCDWNNVIDGPNPYRQGIICDEETDLVFGLDFGK
jgi:hypothetical protein